MCQVVDPRDSSRPHSAAANFLGVEIWIMERVPDSVDCESESVTHVASAVGSADMPHTNW